MSRQVMNMVLYGMLMILSISTNAMEKGHYLFSYFTDDTTEGQQVRYAISDDGIKFVPLNGNRPVIGSDSISISGGVRDPHIIRGNDGYFRMVLTDMDMSKGKWTNRGIVMLRSKDLVHWEHSRVHFPERYSGSDPAWANAVWAPQTIYDPSVNRYMVYYSLHSDKSGPYPVDKVFYSYADDEFSNLETDPAPLFDYDGPSIDTDIVKDENNMYHLFFNTWGNGKTQRRQYVFTDIHDKNTWSLLPGHFQPNEKRSEGSTAYPLYEGGWILCYDCFRDKEFEFCKSDDLINLELIYVTEPNDRFNPKHGSVIWITDEECQRLKEAFPDD
ncbi:MAG: glycoside hydrolase family 43 protein [Lachnospiraceae bacterium]|nr:glycoside hydrolase family 43 protein [Lachnospiraceae bacterium]